MIFLNSIYNLHDILQNIYIISIYMISDNISVHSIHDIIFWNTNGIKFHDDGILRNLLKFCLMLPNYVQQ